MDLNKLERFSKEARKKLLGIVASKLDYVLSFDSVELREKSGQVLELKQELSKKGKEALIEEVAYTWFNRFIALRFMDSGLHGYQGRFATRPNPAGDPGGSSRAGTVPMIFLWRRERGSTGYSTGAYPQETPKTRFTASFLSAYATPGINGCPSCSRSFRIIPSS